MAEAFLAQRIAGSGKDIANAEVTLNFTEVTYNGSEHQPTVQSVMYEGSELAALQDYVIYNAAYRDAGKYNVVISGIGDYRGAKEIPWTIEQAQGSISVEPSSVSISGALGSTTTAKLTYTGDGAITLGASDYVSLIREGTTLTVTSVAEGSGTVDIVLEDGRNYKGDRCVLNVQVSTYSSVFENNTWAQIAQACKDGKAKDLWTVGDTKAFTIGDETYHMQIIGFDHDDLDTTDAYYLNSSYNGNKKKAAMTLCMVEIYTMNYSWAPGNTNFGGWKDSSIRSRMSSIKLSIESGLNSVLRTVKKKTSNGGTVPSITSSQDVLFIMSEIEEFGNNNNSLTDEGTYYEFFKDGGSRIKKYVGSVESYFTRSAVKGSGVNVVKVNENGAAYTAGAQYADGIVLCCCI